MSGSKTTNSKMRDNPEVACFLGELDTHLPVEDEHGLLLDSSCNAVVAGANLQVRMDKRRYQ